MGVLERYESSLDELHVFAEATYVLSDSIDQMIDDFETMLVSAYRQGVDSANEMLSTDLQIDLDDMEEALFVMIDGKTFEDRVRDHAKKDDLPGLQRLAESEFMRVCNTGIQDTGKKADRPTAPVSKLWKTMGDEKVRDSHKFLDGVKVPVNDWFFTIDGDSAQHPGGFSQAENNVNCRCFLLLSNK